METNLPTGRVVPIIGTTSGPCPRRRGPWTWCFTTTVEDLQRETPLICVDFSDRKSYCCVLRREWMGCWGLLGWLLIVSQWISQWIKISLLFVQFECYENEESMPRKIRTQNVDQQVLCTCLYQVSFCVFWPTQNGQNQRRAKIAWWNIHIP